MSKIVRMTSEDSISPESLERLKRLAEMQDETINTDDIPEVRFNLELARERHQAGWTPGKNNLRRAS